MTIPFPEPEERTKMMRAYMQEHARRVYGMHLGRTEELAAAFIARHGLEPEDATVVTKFDAATMTWKSWIERRKRGPSHQGTVPGLPGER